MVKLKLFNGVYSGKNVLVTGHTGFKGSWLCAWLKSLGANVTGYALTPNTSPNHFDILKTDCNSFIGDIANLENLVDVLEKTKPEIVFHMAAQPLVRLSYREPLQTFETNIMGSLKVYEAIRRTPTVKTVISITTDKVYQNNEWAWGYRENDRLGGLDPYSASKAAMELVTYSYAQSFFTKKLADNTGGLNLVTARAGNVIGGGDWAEDRLLPDMIKAANSNTMLEIRSPNAVRPWQHVLEPLSGYLQIGQYICEKKITKYDSYNIGPSLEENITVKQMAEHIKSLWSQFDYKIVESNNGPHEAGLLRLDCSKIHAELGWRPVWGWKNALERTVNWFKSYYADRQVNTAEDIRAYVMQASEMRLPWACK
jgi:CDP-glucose 4,6-dehydratase